MVAIKKWALQGGNPGRNVWHDSLQGLGPAKESFAALPRQA
jgi:hypothetical protein